MNFSLEKVLDEKQSVDANFCSRREKRREQRRVELERQLAVRDSISPLARKLGFRAKVEAWDVISEKLMSEKDGDFPFSYWVFVYKPGLLWMSPRYVIAIRDTGEAMSISGLRYCTEYFRDYPRSAETVLYEHAVEKVQSVIAQNMKKASC